MKEAATLMDHVSLLWETANEKHLTSFRFFYKGDLYQTFWNWRNNQWTDPNLAAPLLELEEPVK